MPCFWRYHLPQWWASQRTWFTVPPHTAEPSSLVPSLSHLLNSTPYLTQMFSGPVKSSELLPCKPSSQALDWPCCRIPGNTSCKEETTLKVVLFEALLKFHFPLQELSLWFPVHISPHSKAAVFFLQISLPGTAPVFQTFASLGFPRLAVSQTTVPCLE